MKDIRYVAFSAGFIKEAKENNIPDNLQVPALMAYIYLEKKAEGGFLNDAWKHLQESFSEKGTGTGHILTRGTIGALLGLLTNYMMGGRRHALGALLGGAGMVGLPYLYHKYMQPKPYTGPSMKDMTDISPETQAFLKNPKYKMYTEHLPQWEAEYAPAQRATFRKELLPQYAQLAQQQDLTEKNYPSYITNVQNFYKKMHGLDPKVFGNIRTGFMQGYDKNTSGFNFWQKAFVPKNLEIARQEIEKFKP